jgi:NAD(P)-dependent dehydrogenase (short-subunit alcohol dehydrogenase family)
MVRYAGNIFFRSRANGCLRLWNAVCTCTASPQPRSAFAQKSPLPCANERYHVLCAKHSTVTARLNSIAAAERTSLPSLDISLQANAASHNNKNGMFFLQGILPISGPPSSENSFVPTWEYVALFLCIFATCRIILASLHPQTHVLMSFSGIDLSGKICLITGGTSGIGKETARAMAQMGAHVVIAARNLELAEKVKQELITTTGNVYIDVMLCDFVSFASIMTFAKSFTAKYDRLHILINNAGLMERERKLSRDGIELTFAVNHLAPFLLTKLLLDTIKASAPARIVNVASDAHRGGVINFDDIEGKQNFGGWKAYSQSKLANILFTRHLATMLRGSGVTVNCLHPGVVATNFFNLIPAPLRFLAKFFMLTPEKGAETTIYLASSPEVENVSGEYFNKKKIALTSSQAQDADTAERLWRVSEQYLSV